MTGERTTRRSTHDQDETQDETRRLLDLAGTLLAQLQEIRSNLERLVAIRMDQARVGLRDGMGQALTWCWRVFSILALTAVSAVLLATGLAGGLSFWLGMPAWAGNLAAGGAILISIYAGVLVKRFLRDRAEKAKLVEKYRTEDGNLHDHPGVPGQTADARS